MRHLPSESRLNQSTTFGIDALHSAGHLPRAVAQDPRITPGSPPRLQLSPEVRRTVALPDSRRFRRIDGQFARRSGGLSEAFDRGEHHAGGPGRWSLRASAASGTPDTSSPRRTGQASTVLGE
uniref:(northern house mosquito) hypothetical protein n=1 Tax=Culex pipiens TaxID=7175 RepID=A0A8D8A119_CULPI